MTKELKETATLTRVLSAAEGERYWIAGDTLTIKAAATDTGGAYTLIEILAAPGEGPPPHIHDNEDETFYVLDGRFEILVGERAIDAGPGTFALVPRGTVHRFRCVAERPSRILVMFTPGGLEGFFREAGIRAADDGTAPPVNAAEIARTEVAAARYGLRVVDWGRAIVGIVDRSWKRAGLPFSDLRHRDGSVRACTGFSDSPIEAGERAIELVEGQGVTQFRQSRHRGSGAAPV